MNTYTKQQREDGSFEVLKNGIVINGYRNSRAATNAIKNYIKRELKKTED